MTQRRLTDRGRERRRQIMELATSLFAEHGYDPTSISDIVDTVGVGKGVFYWYFESKEHLLIEILGEAQAELAAAQRAATESGGEPVARIESAIRATIAWQTAHRSVATIRHFAVGEARFASVLRRNHEAAVAVWVDLVRDGMDSGALRRDSPVMMANAIVGVTVNFDRVLLKHGADPVAVADAAVRFCLGGLVGGEVATRADDGRSIRAS